MFSASTAHCGFFHIWLETRKVTKILQIAYHLILCKLKNWQKFLTFLRTPKNYVFQLLFFGQILTFVARVASLHFHLILFGSYLLFRSLPLKQPFCNSKTKFDLVNSSTLEILSIALISNRKKEWESFCVEVFSQRMKEHQIEKYWRMSKS